MNATTAGAGPLRSRRAPRLAVAALLVLGVMQLTTGRSEAVQFCNTAPIVGITGSGPVDPYPSSITVSGLSGTITDVNVTLLDFTTFRDPTPTSPEFPQGHHWPEDADIMVSAPNGPGVILMSDAGGNNDVTSGPVNAADLTFDQQAANQLPPDSLITSGTWRPVNDDDPIPPPPAPNPSPDIPDEWAPPAPAPTGADLNTFNGLNPNGTWNLWVVDDMNQGRFDIAGGWCVDILTTGGGTPPTTVTPTTVTPTTVTPTTVTPTTVTPTTVTPTTVTPTTVTPTTVTPTTVTPTTVTPTTVTPTTVTPTTVTPTTVTPTTVTPTTVTPTTVTPTTVTPTTVTPTTVTPTTVTPTTVTPTTTAPGTCGGLTPTIVGTSGDDQIFGTAGPDVIVGGGGNDQIRGLEGDDVICGGDGNDQILGGPGNDRLFGDAGSDQLFGEDGDDTVSGGPDNDWVSGGNGNDALSGDGGADRCLGDAGTDSASTCESITGLP